MQIVVEKDDGSTPDQFLLALDVEGQIFLAIGTGAMDGAKGENRAKGILLHRRHQQGHGSADAVPPEINLRGIDAGQCLCVISRRNYVYAKGLLRTSDPLTP